MNPRFEELYKSCRPKEALASQEQFQSANVLLGTEVEKFAELIVQECMKSVAETPFGYKDYRSQIEEDMRNACVDEIKQHFGVKS